MERVADQFREWLEWVLDGDAIGLFNLANELNCGNATDVREAMYRIAVQKGVPEAAFNLGLMLQSQGREDDAISAVEAAHEMGDPQAALWLADCYERRGEIDKALHSARSSTDVEQAPQLLIWILERLGQHSEVADVARRFRLDNASAAVTWALTSSEPVEEKIKVLERHLEAGAIDVLIPLANLYQSVGRIDEALSALRESLNAGEPNARYNLGLVLRANGKSDEGRRQIRMAALDGDENAIAWLADLDGSEPGGNGRT